MKKIAVFGGSGTTGLCAVAAALKKGLGVRALARDPSKFPEDVRSKLEIVQGDVLNLDDVRKTVQGVDGVVVVLGTRNDVRPTTMMSEGTKNILEAMKEAGVKPVSVCLSAFLFMELEKVTPILQDLTRDHQRMLDTLRASDRDWIAVLPPHISAEPSGDYVIKHGASPDATRVISKHDLGFFLVDCLDKPEHYHQLVGIAKKK